MKHPFTLIAVLLVALHLTSSLLAQEAALKQTPRLPLDVLVFAPHPDDEVIGCAGIILQALEQHRRVGVVVITSGDAHTGIAAVVGKKDKNHLAPDDFLKTGAMRQGHSVKAMARLGLPKDELMFLGYPDSGLEKIYTMNGSATFTQMFTRKSETYGVTVPDYHSIRHGKPAPYLKASVVGDIAEVIRERQPKEIYVTHEADTHGDHRAAFWYVRDAVRAANFQGDFFTYVVHGAPPPQPPDRSLVLSKTQAETKRAALIDHQQGTSPVHDRLADEYMKPEESFWRISVVPAPKGSDFNQVPGAWPNHSTAATATKDKPFTNSLGMKFVPVAGTEILMCIHETRRADYAAYAATNSAADASWQEVTIENIPVGAGGDEPVVNVSWDDAKAFCEWLGKKEGRTYRLPTDRKWSVAVGIGEDEPDSGATPESLSAKIKDVSPRGRQWPPIKGAGNYAEGATRPVIKVEVLWKMRVLGEGPSVQMLRQFEETSGASK